MSIKELLTSRKKMWQLEPIDQVKRLLLFGTIYILLITGLSHWVLTPLHVTHRKSEAYEKIVADESRVNLGDMEYNYVNGRNIPRTDKITSNLRVFLEGMMTRYPYDKYHYLSGGGCVDSYTVSAVNNDETQVLLRNNCGSRYPNPAYASRDGDSWSMVAQGGFDIMGIPKCDYVENHHISKDIAPVCGNWLDMTGKKISSYTIR